MRDRFRGSLDGTPLRTEDATVVMWLCGYMAIWPCPNLEITYHSRYQSDAEGRQQISRWLQIVLMSITTFYRISSAKVRR